MPIGLDFFLENPELKQRHELALPTNEMYRFFPPQEEIIMIDSNPEKNYRFIFNGQTKTDFEKKKLDKFQEYENMHGKLNYPPIWLESDTMRILQASEYDISKTYKTIEETTKFIYNIPKSINDKVILLLNSGFFYVYGRDHHFRPIIIVSIKECKNLVSKKKVGFEDIKQSIIYLINYILKYMLVPGQIENWVIFVDFDDVGLGDLSDFKKIFSTLNGYRGRVFRNFIANISGFLKIAVKGALKLFGSASSKKLKILGKDELHKLQEIISPDNIQRKYGGTAPDIIPGVTQLFPPIMPSKNYAIKGEKLNIISEDDYKEMCLYSKPFKPFVISPKYEELWKEEKEKESTKPSIKSIKETKTEVKSSINAIKEQISQKQVEKNYNIENKKKLIINKEMSIKIQRKKVSNFISEFEDIYMIDKNEERKYFHCSPINVQEINCFFKKMKNCNKFYIIH